MSLVRLNILKFNKRALMQNLPHSQTTLFKIQKLSQAYVQRIATSSISIIYALLVFIFCLSVCLNRVYKIQNIAKEPKSAKK